MSQEITLLLHRARSGDRAALDELLPAIYEELHRLAARHLARERRDHALQPTALVNEAYIRLFGGQAPNAQDRRHFLGIAARVMRQVLVDHARNRDRLKRGGAILVPLEERHAVTRQPGIDLPLIDAALERLAEKDPALVRLIDLRYFGGLTAQEIAESAGESVNIVRHNLRYAQACLRKDLARTMGVAPSE